MPTTAELFIPPDRRVALARGIALPDRMTGAVLFADISGFTPLTETFSRDYGPQRGAEELTLQINRVFDALIQQGDAYGGSVIGFSGDAITCWFAGDDGSRAVTCAQAMQHAMAQQNQNTHAASIALKIGIAYGAVRRFQVGDPQFGLNDVLAGATLDRLANAELLADKGEIVIDEATAQAQAVRVTVMGWRSLASDAGSQKFAVLSALNSPAPRQNLEPAAFALSDAQVRPWLIPAMYERISSGQHAFLADLRSVVTLFLRFRGIDFDNDDAAGEKLDAFIQRVQRITARYEGILQQITVGDKGSYLMLSFGALLAHTDDPPRAVSAALEMREVTRELSYLQPPQIGISRGMTFAGAYGASTRLTYGTLGDETNIAARLMQYAQPGQIIVSKRLRDVLPPRYRLEPMGDVQVKGKHEAIPLYQVLGFATGAQTIHAPPILVGREAERARLYAALQALRAGKSSMLVIEGEPGLGKSQLAAELLANARGADVLALFGAGEAVEEATPYFAWRAVMQQSFDSNPNESRDALRARVMEILQRENFARHAPLLNAILALDFPENDLTAQMSAPVRADNLHALVAHLLQARAQAQPLLLVLDDAQWLDSASWLLLRYLKRHIQPQFQLLTLRPPGTPLPTYYTELVNTEGAQWIELAPLTGDTTSTLVAQHLDVNELAADLAALIRERAEGNPFFSIELAYALRDAQLIKVTNGHAQLAPEVDLAQLTLPDTIQGVITSRIDRLAPSQQLALKVASVIGRVFAYRLLRDVEPVEAYKQDLSDDLESLSQLDLTELQTPEPQLAYHFKQLITQQVAYNLMLFAQRRELHCSVAEWYEVAHAENLAPFYPLLAYHWEQAENRDKTIAYAERAGKDALAASAYKEAVGFFQRVRALDAETYAVDDAVRARRARVERMLGEAYRRWGHLEEARTTLERAAELYGYPSPAVKGNVPTKLLGSLTKQARHRFHTPKPLADEPARQQLRQVAQIYEMLSELYFFRGQRGASLYSSLHMLNLAEQAGPSPELARAYGNTSLLAGLFGIHRLSESYYQRAVETANIVNIPATRADVERTNALYRSGVGQWARANTQVTTAMSVHEQLGDKRYWGDCVALLGAAAYYQADYLRASELYARIADDKHGIALHQIWGLAWQGGIALRQGNYAAAFEFLNRARPLAAAAQEKAAQIAIAGFLSAAHFYRGQADDALRLADECLAMLLSSGGPTVYYALDGYYYAAAVYAARLESQDLAADERKKLRAQLTRVLRAWKGFTRLYPIGQPGQFLHQGLAQALDGHPQLAQREWKKTLAAAQHFQMPYEEARAHYEIARHLDKNDSARSEHLRHAAEIFSQIGAQGDAERALAIHT